MTEPHPWVSCGRSSQQRHLLVGEYQGKPFFICADCLPYLIHLPETLGQGGAKPEEQARGAAAASREE